MKVYRVKNHYWGDVDLVADNMADAMQGWIATHKTDIDKVLALPEEDQDENITVEPDSVTILSDAIGFTSIVLESIVKHVHKANEANESAGKSAP